jgi:hypothetical protein
MEVLLFGGLGSWTIARVLRNQRVRSYILNERVAAFLRAGNIRVRAFCFSY